LFSCAWKFVETPESELYYIRHFAQTRKSGSSYVIYGKSASSEGWKWFSLDVEITENPEE